MTADSVDHCVILLVTMQGLWRGTLAGQLLYVPYAAVQFVTLQQFNLAARKWQLSGEPHFLGGALCSLTFARVCVTHNMNGKVASNEKASMRLG